MRRLPLILVILLAGCAQSEQPATDTMEDAAPAAISLADIAGTWAGPVMPVGKDTTIANLEVLASEDPAAWAITVTNPNDPAWTTTVTPSVIAEGDSVIIDAGPFASVVRKDKQVAIHGAFRLVDGNFAGMVETTYPDDTTTMMVRTVLVRQP